MYSFSYLEPVCCSMSMLEVIVHIPTSSLSNRQEESLPQYGKLCPLLRLSPTSDGKTAMELHVELSYSEVMQQKDPSIRNPKNYSGFITDFHLFFYLEQYFSRVCHFFNYYFCFFPPDA